MRSFFFEELSNRMTRDFEYKCEEFFMEFKRIMTRQFSDFLKQALQEAFEQHEEAQKLMRQKSAVESQFTLEDDSDATRDFVSERPCSSIADEEISFTSNIHDQHDFTNTASQSKSSNSSGPTLVDDGSSKEYEGQHYQSNHLVEFKGEPTDQSYNQPTAHAAGEAGEGSSGILYYMRKNTREHVCPVCSKSFRLLTTFKNHLRIHTGERPYSCSICGMSFTQVSNLNAHMRVHTLEKPYSCSICGKAFAKSWNMKVHSLLHQK